ncbi:putative thymidylate synthase [Cucumispora dikerogammari]|nr:putative thymidylate synthase [Cucumispora dikerogammari]
MSLNDGAPIRECLNLIAIIDKEDPNNFHIPEYLKYNKQNIEDYIQTFCYINTNSDNAYTYGNRLRKDSGDQIKDIIKLLKKDTLSKRAYSTTWQIGDMFSNSPPCFVSLQASIQDNQLNITSYLRSNDVFRAWPLNAFGIRYLQNLISKELDIKIGLLVTISHSAQIYSTNISEAKDIVTKHYKKENTFTDLRGYYVISVEKEEINVKHYSVCGTLLRMLKGKSEREITDSLNKYIGPIDPYHVSYITRELFKAEICLKFKKEFKQDTDLSELLN